MSARALNVGTYVLPNTSVFAQYGEVTPMQAAPSFSYHINSLTSIRTLSVNSFTGPGKASYPLLYVPTLSHTDICYNQSLSYVPANVTRRANFPSWFQIVALAPWVSINCTKSFLKAAMQDADYLRAVIFYQANDTTLSKPPPVSNVIWDLEDGGRWKSNLGVPAYAIPGLIGRQLMQELSYYSGNVTTAPNGTALSMYYGSGGMPRLFADIMVETGPSLPSLWVFLIIVLAILLAIVTASSVFMGYVQRHRRRVLRRRVENGEVDLEALGIKRMNVPQSQLDKMPLYIYQEDPATKFENSDATEVHKVSDSTISEKQDIEVKTDDSSNIGPSDTGSDLPIPGPDVIKPSGQLFSQTTCAICLDDFISGTNNVRELPCHHIFHPECVDPFLLEHSSACPVCKKSVLPNGFCPDNITNAMVRREQLIRRIQQRRQLRSASTVSALHANRSEAMTMYDVINSRLAGIQEALNPSSRRHDARLRAQSRSQATRAQFEMRSFPSAFDTQASSPANIPPGTTTSTVDTTNPPTADQPVTEDQPTPLPASTSRPHNTQRNSILNLLSESNPQRRRELARRRVLANLQQSDAAIEQDLEQEQQRLPFWRRAIGRVFPALTS